MLLETNDALRVERIYILIIIFMVLSETNGALMVNISQLHFQFTVCESDLLIHSGSGCHDFGRDDFRAT